MKRGLLFLCVVAIFTSSMITFAEAKRPQIGNDHLKSWRGMAYLASLIVDKVEEKEESPALPEPDPFEISILAKTLYGECRGIPSDTRKAAVVWVIFNRVDSPQFPNTIYGVLTQRNQFSGYRSSYPVTDELYSLAKDVWYRWQSEKTGQSYIGRVIPKEYCYFRGNGRENIFRTRWNGGAVWNWSLESPYTT